MLLTAARPLNIGDRVITGAQYVEQIVSDRKAACRRLAFENQLDADRSTFLIRRCHPCAFRPTWFTVCAHVQMRVDRLAQRAIVLLAAWLPDLQAGRPVLGGGGERKQQAVSDRAIVHRDGREPLPCDVRAARARATE